MRKFRFYRYALMIGVCAFFGLQCERTFLPVDSSEKIDYLQGNTVARVTVKMFDIHTLAPLSDVDVEIAGIGSAKSNSDGIAIFDSVKTGSYLITCTKEGFEGTLDHFSLSVDSNSNTVPVVNQSTDAFLMARKGAAVRGNLYLRKGTRIYPVDGATVECQLTNTSISFQKPLVVTTSSSGTYTLSNLPEYSTYTINVRFFEDESVSYRQTGSVSLAGRAAGDTLRATDIILEKFTDGNFIVMNHNLETFTRTDSLIIEFSEAVDKSKLGQDSIYVTLDDLSKTRIITNNIWRDDDKTLVIVPFDGSWDNGQAYTLVVRKLQSVKGKPLDNTALQSYDFSPTVAGALDKVVNVRFRVGASDTNKVDFNTASITLLWSRLENAVSYQIFKKSSSDSTWVLYDSTFDTTASVSTTNEFNSGNQMKFIVLGKNSSNMSSFENATVLTVQDKKGPLIHNAPVILSYNFDNSGSSTRDTIEIVVSSSYLPEPMDTTKKPSVKIKEAGYLSGSTMYGDTTYRIDPNACFWEWTSERAGVMSVIVAEEKNGAYDSLKIDFTSVPDEAGNKPDTTEGAGYLYYYTRP